jgi:hypothetical protein
MKPSRPDSLLLRVPIFVCLVGVVTGNVLTYFVKNAELAGRWTLVASLAAGLLFSLLYCSHILFCRLHQRLSDLLALLAFHALNITLVTQVFFWLSRQSSPFADASWNTLILAAASLTLLFRASILALVAAQCLPEEWTLAIVVPRKSAVVLREERRNPRWYICLFYWTSPLAWWLLLLLVVAFNSSAIDAEIVGALFAVAIFLQLRLLLGGFVYLHTASEWWKKKKPIDLQFVREARWYLFGSALPAAGILAFYAFCLTASRIHQDAMSASLAPEVARDTATLRVFLNSPDPDDQDPWTVYAAIQSKLPRIVDYAQLRHQWDHPDNFKILRASQAQLEALRRAAIFERCAPMIAFGVDPLSYWNAHHVNFGYISTLMLLHGRLAALDQDWDALLDDTQSSLGLARQLQQQRDVSTFRLGNYVDDITIMALIPALMRSGSIAPDDVLERAQLLLRNHAQKRTGSLQWLVEVDRRRTLCVFDTNCASTSGGWLGRPEVLELFVSQPIVRWKWRDSLVSYYDVLNYSVDNALWCANVNPYTPLPGQGFAQIVDPAWLPNSNLVLHDYNISCAFRMADAALAAGRYYRKHNRWPQSLQDCVPEFLPAVPMDPFTPAETVYFAANPPRVYSAGAKGQIISGCYERTNPVDELLDQLCENGYSNLVLFCGPHDALEFSKCEDEDVKNINVDDEMNFVTSDDADARALALRNLAKAAPHINEPRLVPYFLKQLDSRNMNERIWAAYILGRAGIHATAALSRIEQEAQIATDATLHHFAVRAAKRINIRDVSLEQHAAPPPQ